MAANNADHDQMVLDNLEDVEGIDIELALMQEELDQAAAAVAAVAARAAANAAEPEAANAEGEEAPHPEEGGEAAPPGDPPRVPTPPQRDDVTEIEDPVIPFAITPAQAIKGVLNLTTKMGANIYQEGCKALPHIEFACEEQNLSAFIRLLGYKASSYGWQDVRYGGIIDIVLEGTSEEPTKTINLLSRYGEVTLTEVQHSVRGYMHEQARACQDEHMLFNTIMNTLTIEAKRKVILYERDYIYEGCMIGTSLLKIVIRESHIDSNAQILALKRSLNQLGTYMVEVKNDITAFNNHVRSQTDALMARGVKASDLLSQLFDGYKECKDETFRRYIQTKLDDYEEGQSDMTSTKLMLMAETKFKTLVASSKWEAPTEQDTQLLALTAKLKQTNENFNKYKQGNNKKPWKDKEKGTTKSGADQGLEKGWKTKQPAKALLNKSVKALGREWYWCSKDTGGKCDGVFRCHKPSECHGTAVKKTDALGNKGNKYKGNKRSPPSKHESQEKEKKVKSLTAQLAELTKSTSESEDDTE
eukprot:scaffold5509_cov185-Chaetoceros_neogracile.AAC.1